MDDRLLDAIELGTGTWQWGDRGMWGFGKGYGTDEVRGAFQASLEAGVTFFDTAEIYGLGRSERLLGGFLREGGGQPVVATKFLPLFFRLRKKSLLSALRGSLRRLGLARVELYQIHFPFPPVSIETWMDAMADAREAGLLRAVGISNCDLAQTRRAQEALARHGLRLCSNQVHYSLLHRAPEDSGLRAYCREQGIRLIAYSPLEMGVLGGRYDAGRPPPGKRGRHYNAAYLGRAAKLLTALREIAAAHDRKPSQVALRWLIEQGALPIPGAKSAAQVAENAGALGFHLDEGERDRLDRESRACQS